MVSIHHPNAEMYFSRDVECIRDYFSKRFGYSDAEAPSFDSDVVVKVDLDQRVKASGSDRRKHTKSTEGDNATDDDDEDIMWRHEEEFNEIISSYNDANKDDRRRGPTHDQDNEEEEENAAADDDDKQYDDHLDGDVDNPGAPDSSAVDPAYAARMARKDARQANERARQARRQNRRKLQEKQSAEQVDYESMEASAVSQPAIEDQQELKQDMEQKVPEAVDDHDVHEGNDAVLPSVNVNSSALISPLNVDLIGSIRSKVHRVHRKQTAALRLKGRNISKNRNQSKLRAEIDAQL